MVLIQLQIHSTHVLSVDHGVLKEAKGSSVRFCPFGGHALGTSEKDCLCWSYFTKFLHCHVFALQVDNLLEAFNFVLFENQTTRLSI